MTYPTKLSRFKPVTFTAIDGEGYDKNGKHYYNLLATRCRDRDWQNYLTIPEGENKLSTWAIFDFLIRGLSEVKDTVFVMFYFNYDVTKWIEDLTPEQKEILWHTSELQIKDPWYNAVYRLTYIPHKIFRIEKQYYDKNKKLRRVVRQIYDAFGFFQSSFVRALEQWNITPDDTIVEMKAKRGTFKQSQIWQILEYTYAECDRLCLLMNKVKDALYAEKIPVKKWYGAGAIAEAILYKYDTKDSIRVPAIVYNASLEEALLGSYFGGRFEIFRKGIIPETHQLDINSAYPYAMSTLPSFEECTVRFERQYTQHPYSLWFVTYNILEDGNGKSITKYTGAQTFLCGPFAYRTKQGSILYPYYNPYGVWVHQVELETAISLYGAKYFKIHYGYSITPQSYKRAFTFINDIAARRLELKRVGDERNIVLKLGLNSLYGKTAQSQTNPDYEPPFQNRYIAGYITAFTRAKLLKKAFECGLKGSGIIQFATDGIFSCVPASNTQNSSADFGDWEYAVFKDQMLYIQAGVYYSISNARLDKRRTRGFHKNSLESDNVFHLWHQFTQTGEPDSIQFRERRFIGIGSCLVERKWTKYGKFIDQERLMSFLGPATKQFANPGGQQLFSPGFKWDAMWPRIYGITRKEIYQSHDYYIMIPNPDYVTEQSAPYTPHKMRDWNSLPDEIKAIMQEQVLADDQPDFYEYEFEKTDYQS